MEFFGGDTLKFFAHQKEYEVTETGHFVLDKVKTNELRSGDVGYVVGSIRDMAHIEAGDTITTSHGNATTLCPVIKKLNQWYFQVCIQEMRTTMTIYAKH